MRAAVVATFYLALTFGFAGLLVWKGHWITGCICVLALLSVFKYKEG